MSDHNDESFRAGVWVVAIVAFIASTWYSWQELNYMASGQVATASITRVIEVERRGRRGARWSELQVHYTFAETDGSKRDEYVTRDLDWTPPAAAAGGAPAIDVQYIPGKRGRSRFDGEHNALSLLFFFGSLAFVLVKSVLFFIEFNRYERERKAKEAEYGY